MADEWKNQPILWAKSDDKILVDYCMTHDFFGGFYRPILLLINSAVGLHSNFTKKINWLANFISRLSSAFGCHCVFQLMFHIECTVTTWLFKVWKCTIFSHLLQKYLYTYSVIECFVHFARLMLRRRWLLRKQHSNVAPPGARWMHQLGVNYCSNWQIW